MFLAALFDVFLEYKLSNLIFDGHNQLQQPLHAIVLGAYGLIEPDEAPFVPLIPDDFNFTVLGVNFSLHSLLDEEHQSVEYPGVNFHFLIHQHPMILSKELFQDF